MVADGKPPVGGAAGAGDGLREETLLQQKLAEYATFIGRFGLGAATLAFAAMTIRFRCGRAGVWPRATSSCRLRYCPAARRLCSTDVHAWRTGLALLPAGRGCWGVHVAGGCRWAAAGAACEASSA